MPGAPLVGTGGADPESSADAERGTASESESTIELLAEEQVDHSHACSHAKFDDPVPLDAGATVEDAPTVDETHTIWEVSHDGPGYVVFDVESHWYDGPFVFYTVEGAVRPLVGTTDERAPVSDEDCEELDEYAKVDADDGEIVLAAGTRSVPFYADADSVVGTQGVEDALDDWRRGLLETDLLRAVIEAWWLDCENTAGENSVSENAAGEEQSVPGGSDVATGRL